MPEFQRGNEDGETLIVTQSPHFPTMHTRETVTHLAAFGLDENQVAVILRCTPDDVRRHYMMEMEHGLTLINSRVMSAVVHEALYSRDVAAMKLWLINKAGWRAGDGNKQSVLLPNSDGVDPNTGEMTIVQRREVITKLLVKATQHKRREEHVIDAVAVQKPNGNGGNGHGNGSNGTKHR